MYAYILSILKAVAVLNLAAGPSNYLNVDLFRLWLKRIDSNRGENDLNRIKYRFRGGNFEISFNLHHATNRGTATPDGTCECALILRAPLADRFLNR